MEIEGWMGDVELVTLANMAKGRNKILEIGSWYGRSTRTLAENCPGIVYAVDWWNGSEGHVPSTEAAKNWNGDYAMMQFWQNNGDLIIKGKIIPIRMRSDHANWILTFLGLKFDMIFIDGDHNYLGCKADIIGTRALMGEGCLLCGHDYYNWAGVKQAVDELIPAFKVVNGTSIWHTY